jgi:hypothetical protein
LERERCDETKEEEWEHTFKYSFVASWYSLFMVPGAGPANWRMVTKMTKLIATPRKVYPATYHPSFGGGRARGPWSPKAIQYAVPVRHSIVSSRTCGEEAECSPAFFSCGVNSAHGTFMRSRSAIHRSACSCGGMPSHLFSMFASVGLEMAWAFLVWIAETGRTIARELAASREERRMDWRSMVRNKGKDLGCVDGDRRRPIECVLRGKRVVAVVCRASRYVLDRSRSIRHGFAPHYYLARSRAEQRLLWCSFR